MVDGIQFYLINNGNQKLGHFFLYCVDIYVCMFVVLCVSLCVCVICCVHLIMQEPENECHFCFHYFCQKKINRQVSFHTFPSSPSKKNTGVFSYFINPFTSFLSPLSTKMQLKHTSIFTCNLSLETRLITQHNIHITTPYITH